MSMAVNARTRLAKELGATRVKRQDENIIYEGDLVERIVKDAEDPEVDVPQWIKEGTPAGVKQKMPGRGTFPAKEPTRAQVESKRFYEK